MKKIILDSKEVLELYKSGLTAEQVGHHFGCSKMPVLKILRDAGISKDSKRQQKLLLDEQKAKLKQQKLTKRTEELNPAKIIEYYKNHTLKETASNFKAGQATIRKICKENNFIKETFTWADWSEETKEKAKESRIKTSLEKYGVKNVFQADSIKESIQESIEKKYGVKSFLQTDEAKQANLEYRKHHQEEINEATKKTTLEKYGETHYMRTQEGRELAKRCMEKTREKGLQKLKELGVENYFQVPEIKSTIEATNLIRYGVKHPMQNSEIWKKTVASAKMSSLEKRFSEFLTNKRIEFIPQYTISSENGSHHYDFAIFKDNKLKILVDCDGLYFHGYTSDFTGKFVSDTGDDVRLANLPKDVLFIKIIEGSEKEGYSEFLKAYDNIDYHAYLEDVYNWCRQIEFPYPEYSLEILKNSWESLKKGYWKSTHSRQGEKLILEFYKSIWDANVKGKLSPKEAWQNDNLLKKSIQNRVIYKDFVDPSRVLTGFSVMKIAPRVSIFSPMLAKYLIEKYLNQFSEIFDPCSGFGGRLLGTAALNKKYIGYDINSITIEESKNLINFLSLINCEVFNTDSLKSSGEFECLFTCPPYSEKERWNQNIQNLSAEEWITYCLKAFRCKKYLFVVDNPGKYSDKIAEIIKYQSHFGERQEYVISLESV